MLGLDTLKAITATTRRYLTGSPTSAWPEAHVAWTQEQIRAYSTLQNYVGPLSLYQDNLTGETAEMRLAYRRMLSKPEIKGPLFQKVYNVCSLDVQVISGNKKNPKANELAGWIDYSVSASGGNHGGSPGGWPGLLFNVLMPSLFDGFSVTAKVFDTIPAYNARYPGWWTLRAAKSKDTTPLRFRLDPFKNLITIQTVGQNQGGINFDPADFIVFTHLSLFESPFGMSDLRACYRASVLIEGAIKLRAILLENFSGPYLVAKSDEANTKAKIGKVMADARARGWIVVPKDCEFDVINLATSSVEQFQSAIDDYRKEIAISLQGASLQMYESNSPTGQGSSDVARKMSDLPTWWAATSVAACLTHQLIPDLADPHFDDSVERPKIILGGIDPQAALQNAQRFKFWQDLGGKLSTEQVAEELNVETPRRPDDVLEKAPPPQFGPGQPGQGNSPGSGGGPAPLTFRG